MAKFETFFDPLKVSPDDPFDNRVEYDFQYINEQIAGFSLSFCQSLVEGFQDGNEYTWRNVQRGERKAGSASINLRTGHWCDLGGGEADQGGDFVSFYAYHKGIDQSDAAYDICGRFGLRPNSHLDALPAREPRPPKNPPMPTEEQRRQKNTGYALQLIEKATPAGPETPAGRYLAGRGISPNSDTLAGVDFNGEHVCLFVGRDAGGKPTCVQRVFIDEQGQRLFDPETGELLEKLTLGAMKGSPFRVPASRSDGAGRVIVTEGPEDALSISAVTGLEAWAVLGGSVLKSAPAAGRDVVILADSDGRPETVDRLNKAREELAARNRSFNIIYPPHPHKDANDMLLAGASAQLIEMIEGAFTTPTAVAPGEIRLSDWTESRYDGEAKDIEYLCEGTIPLGVPFLLAGFGGVGKSFTTLDLVLELAAGATSTHIRRVLGGEIKKSGTAVMITAEDSRDSIHRRLESIDPGRHRNDAKGRMIIVPMPDAGGPQPLVVSRNGEFHTTPFFASLKRQLRAIDDLLVVIIDPLQTFIAADVNKDPAAGQYLWTALASICADTGAALIVTHHMNKGKEAIRTVEEARNAIRGTSALVDGARGAYVLWETEESRAKHICKLLNVPFIRQRVVCGAVVKSNNPADMTIRILIRQDNGRLEDLTERVEEIERKARTLHQFQVKEILKEIELRARKPEQAFYLSAPGRPSKKQLNFYIAKKYEITPKAAESYIESWLEHEWLDVVDLSKRGGKKNALTICKIPEEYQV